MVGVNVCAAPDVLPLPTIPRWCFLPSKPWQPLLASPCPCPICPHPAGYRVNKSSCFLSSPGVRRACKTQTALANAPVSVQACSSALHSRLMVHWQRAHDSGTLHQPFGWLKKPLSVCSSKKFRGSPFSSHCLYTVSVSRNCLYFPEIIKMLPFTPAWWQQRWWTEIQLSF